LLFSAIIRITSLITTNAFLKKW